MFLTNIPCPEVWWSHFEEKNKKTSKQQQQILKLSERRLILVENKLVNLNIKMNSRFTANKY